MDATDRIKQLRLTPGRQVVAARQVRRLAQDEAMPALAQRCERVEQRALERLDAERAWSVISKSGSTREEALRLDKLVDGALFAIEDGCAAHERAAKAGVQTPQSEAAALIRATCLQVSASAIARGTYEEQFASMQALATRWEQAPLKQAAATLGLTPYFELILSNLDAYEHAIAHRSRDLTGRQLAATRRQSHDELCELIALILVETSGDPAKRARLLAPIDEQTQALRAQRDANRPTTDLNPDTGAEVPDP